MTLPEWLQLVAALRRADGLTDELRYLTAARGLGQPGAAIPPELLPMGLRMHLRGFLTLLAVQTHRRWVWPRWIERQFDPADPAFTPRGHLMAAINGTGRNWTIIGPLGGTRRGVVDGRGLVTPWPDGPSLDCWVRVDGQPPTFPSRLARATQRVSPKFPVVKTEWSAGGGVSVRQNCWGAVLPSGREALIGRVKLLNGGSAPVAGEVMLAIRPANPEGIAPIHGLDRAAPGRWLVDGQPFLIAPPPAGHLVGSAALGDPAAVWTDGGLGNSSPGVRCPAGLATVALRYPFKLEPGATFDLNLTLPLDPAAPSDSAVEYDRLKTVERGRWRRHLTVGAHLTLPDPAMQAAFELNRAHLPMFDVGPRVVPGALTYRETWFRDAAFLLHAFDLLGHGDRVADKLRGYPSRQDRDGCFRAQTGEWDATGQAIWSVAEHVRLGGDRSVAEALYGSLSRGAGWIATARETTRALEPARAGLLPAGLSAEHLGPPDHYYWDNFWGLAGLRDAAFLARALGRTADADRFGRASDAYRADLRKSLRLNGVGKPGAWPAAPGRPLEAGAIGSLVALYPLALVPPDEPGLVATLGWLTTAGLHDGAFFQEHFHAGLNAYLTLHLAHALLMRRSVAVWPLVERVLRLMGPTGTWPEAVHPRTGGGTMGEGHHGWAAAEWLILSRRLLALEVGRDLLVTPAPHPSWSTPGTVLRLTDAPTHFGPVSLEIRTSDDQATLSLDRLPPRDPTFATDLAAVRWRVARRPLSLLIDGERAAVKLDPLVAGYELVLPAGMATVTVRFS